MEEEEEEDRKEEEGEGEREEERPSRGGRSPKGSRRRGGGDAFALTSKWTSAHPKTDRFSSITRES